MKYLPQPHSNNPHGVIQLKSLKKVGADLKKEIDRGVESASKELNKAVHGKEYIVSSMVLACGQKRGKIDYEY